MIFKLKTRNRFSAFTARKLRANNRLNWRTYFIYGTRRESIIFNVLYDCSHPCWKGVCARRFISRFAGRRVELRSATGASRILLSVPGMSVKKALITPRALFIKTRFGGLKRHVLIKIISFHANFVSSLKRPLLNFLKRVTGLFNYCFRQRFNQYCCNEWRTSFRFALTRMKFARARFFFIPSESNSGWSWFYLTLSNSANLF